MTDIEFDILDELYFLTSWKDLSQSLDVPEEEIKRHLREMVKKDWVKCFESVDQELGLESIDFENRYKEYYYLASKRGLMAHNVSE